MKSIITSIKTSRQLKLLLLIILFGFLVRLYRIDFPLADWHSWRQTDTAAVSKIYVDKGLDLLYPRYFDISNIQTGVDNPEGFRFVEFPIYNFLHASLYILLPILSLEVWGRLITVICSVLTSLFLFLIIKRKYNLQSAFFVLVIYLFMPFSIYYGRTILPDTPMVASSIAAIYFFDKYLNVKKRKAINFLLSAILMSVSLLLKPYAVFFLLVHFLLAIEKFKFKIFLRKELYLYTLLIAGPLIAWRAWILNFPEGIPANAWLLNGNGIRFRPAFFRWIIYERITKLISGYFGILFLALGIIKLLPLKKNLLVIGFIFSSALYVSIFATGNVQHDYYQITIIPTLVIIMGLGASHLYSKGKYYKVLTLTTLLISFIMSFNLVKDYFNINNIAIVNAGRMADRVLPEDAKVIAPYGGDTSLLYYINRKGWPAFTDSIENLKMKGASHMVIVNPNESDLNGFGKQYEIILLDNDSLILKL